MKPDAAAVSKLHDEWISERRKEILRQVVGQRGDNFDYLMGYFDGLRDKLDNGAFANQAMYMQGWHDGVGDKNTAWQELKSSL